MLQFTSQIQSISTLPEFENLAYFQRTQMSYLQPQLKEGL